MNSFIKYNINHTSIIPSKSLTNNKKYYLSKNHNNMNKIISSYKLKNKSRNNNTLLLLTEPNLKDRKNDIKSLFNTSKTIKLNKKYTHYILNNSNKTTIKNKKDFFKKKLKSLLINLENNENKEIFKDKKLYLFDKINLNKEKIPKIKSQEQFNYYLINDFKENEPPKNEIKKSLKNKKIDEEFDIYKSFIQEKKCYNNVSLIKEYKKKENITDNNSAINTNNNINITTSYQRKNKKKLTYYKPVVFYNDIYKNYYKSKEKDNQNHFNESNKTNIIVKKPRKSVIFQKNLSKDVKELFQINSPKKKQSTHEKRGSYNTFNNNISISNYSYSNKNQSKKHSFFFNKNEQSYIEQKKEYNKYLKKVRHLKSKIFVEKIKKIETEKNKLKEENEYPDDKKLKLLTLNEDKLLLEVRRKNAFIDSFCLVGQNINDKEDDIDEDNYKGIKNYHLNMGMGATYMYSLKYKIEPRYILKNFKKKTIDKYKGNKGIYFGPNNKDIEYLKTMYKK